MIAFSFLAAAISIPVVIAFPAMQRRQGAPPECGAGSPGDFVSAPPFTLTALNTTQPNSNNDGSPLVAVPGGIFGADVTYMLAVG